MTLKNKTLNSINFDENQKTLIMGIINQFGSGDHPYCDEMSFGYFKVKYLEEILTEKYDVIKENLTKKGEDVFYTILNVF